MIKSVEKWCTAAVCLALVVALSLYYSGTSVLKHLDTVFLFESSASVLESGWPVSNTVASWPDALKTFTLPVDALCESGLKREKADAYNILDNHAYAALYPISLLVAVVGAEAAFALLNALAHVLLLVIPFVMLRRMGAGITQGLVFSLCIALYPAWAYSAVGDYYLDRLYMPFALLSLYLFHTIVRGSGQAPNRYVLAGFAASVIAAAMFTERAALMMMGEIAFFLVLFPQARRHAIVWKLMLGLLVLLGLYLFLYFRFLFEGIDGGGNLLANASAVLHDPLPRLRTPALIPFVLANLLLFGVFLPFAGVRYAALALGAMAPNFFVSVGGAELNGWSTHYHAMYVPFLVFAASIGYLALIERHKARPGRVNAPLLVAIGAIVASGYFNPYSGEFNKNFLASVKDGILGKSYRYHVHPEQSSERYEANMLKELATIIPAGVRVSAIEGVMPALYGSRTLSLYPIDMDSADYLVISGTAPDGQVASVTGATSYLGQSQMEALNKCLHQRMIGKGFVLDKGMVNGVLVFRRDRRG